MIGEVEFCQGNFVACSELVDVKVFSSGVSD